MAGAKVRTVIKRRLGIALSCLYEANELNAGKYPLSPQIHTAIYVVEQALALLKRSPKDQNLKRTPKRI